MAEVLHKKQAIWGGIGGNIQLQEDLIELIEQSGGIPAPQNPQTGAFLMWNGTAWIAQVIPSAQGVNF